MSAPRNARPRIVIAADKFKGSLDGAGVARALTRGLLAGLPEARIVTVPVADGGEGSLDAAVRAGFTRYEATVSGPTGEPVRAALGLRERSGGGREALVEMAEASGLDALPGGIRRARTASSRGTGELIREALDRGATRVILAIGGSACTDGGAGALAALGLGLYDARGDALADGGAALRDLDRVETAGLDPRIARTEFILASDVDNPLLGPRGAAAIFGPQKGADYADIAVLEAGLARLVECLERAGVPRAAECAEAPGAGAAGGLGFGALMLLGAKREPGTAVILELAGLAEALAGADLVITGEGSLDAQSLGGKTPMGVAAAARAAGVPVIAVCGISDLPEQRLHDAGFAARYRLSDLEPDPARSMAGAAGLLTRIGESIASDLAGGPA